VLFRVGSLKREGEMSHLEEERQEVLAVVTPQPHKQRRDDGRNADLTMHVEVAFIHQCKFDLQVRSWLCYDDFEMY